MPCAAAPASACGSSAIGRSAASSTPETSRNTTRLISAPPPTAATSAATSAPTGERREEEAERRDLADAEDHRGDQPEHPGVHELDYPIGSDAAASSGTHDVARGSRMPCRAARRRTTPLRASHSSVAPGLGVEQDRRAQVRRQTRSVGEQLVDRVRPAGRRPRRGRPRRPPRRRRGPRPAASSRRTCQRAGAQHHQPGDALTGELLPGDGREVPLSVPRAEQRRRAPALERRRGPSARRAALAHAPGRDDLGRTQTTARQAPAPRGERRDQRSRARRRSAAPQRPCRPGAGLPATAPRRRSGAP